MEVTNELMDYLKGNKFSNGFQFKFAEKNMKNRKSRLKILEDIVKGKNIIHVGACDHLPLIEYKISKNIWLHKILQESAKNVVGLDIDKEAIEYTNKIGYNNIFYGDILLDTESMIKEKLYKNFYGKYDFMLLGEIIEHVNNPVEFLAKINNNYSDSVERIVVTVPNAFSYINIKYLFQGKEHNNSDHKYLFTPYTILKVLVEAGFYPEKILFADYPSVKRAILFPVMNRDIMSLSLIVIGRFGETVRKLE